MNWKDVKREMLRNPSVRREYEALEPEYQLARSIVAQRTAKGWSQQQLAQRVGTKQPVISRLESGSARPSVTLLQRVARALDADLIVRLDPRPARSRSAMAAKHSGQGRSTSVRQRARRP